MPLYTANYAIFDLHVTGMKPNTPHDVYFDGILYNNYVVPYAGQFGDRVTPNNEGRASFHLHFHPDHHLQWSGVNSETTPYFEYIDKMNRLAGPKHIEMKSSDGLSSSGTTIQVHAFNFLPNLWMPDGTWGNIYDFTAGGGMLNPSLLGN